MTDLMRAVDALSNVVPHGLHPQARKALESAIRDVQDQAPVVRQMAEHNAILRREIVEAVDLLKKTHDMAHEVDAHGVIHLERAEFEIRVLAFLDKHEGSKA